MKTQTVGVAQLPKYVSSGNLEWKWEIRLHITHSPNSSTHCRPFTQTSFPYFTS